MENSDDNGFQKPDAGAHGRLHAGIDGVRYFKDEDGKLYEVAD